MSTTSPIPSPIPSPAVLEAAPTTRKARFIRILACLPSMIAAAVMIYALSVGSSAPIDKIYAREAQLRWNQKDFPAALVCSQRLVRRNPAEVEYRYLMTLVLERLGRLDEAEAVARSIAPEDRSGFALAHFWLAERLMADPRRLASRAPAIEGHLRRGLQSVPKAPQAKAMLGKLYALTGRARDARVLLEAVAGDEPERLLDLARVCRSLGDANEANRRGRAARDAAQARTESRPDDKPAWFLWADACTFLEDYPQAVQVLEQAAKITGEPGFKKVAADVCAIWSAALGKRGLSSAGERLSVLQLGLKYDEANPRVLDQISGLVNQADAAQAEQGRAALRAVLASGRAPAVAHFALGNDDWSRGRLRAARDHWEQAYRIDPKLTAVANNLAWMLAYHDPTDLPRALALIDEALNRSPADPRLRGTRGQVLVKLGRWKESLAEIESALSGGETSPGLHDSLAQAYDHLGMAEMAAEHRKFTKP